MSSNSIYPHVPYFYIIQHTPSGKFYAGSKWKEGCHPDTFMTPDGYQTSSETIKNFIKLDGLDSFKIISLLTDAECFMSVYDYETVFLQTHNIKESDEWLNRHNNDGFFSAPYGSREFESAMIVTYGATNIMYVDATKEKMKATWIENHGVDHPMKSPVVVAKMINTIQEKYGQHFSSLATIKEKKKLTYIENYGVDNPMKSKVVKDKSKATSMEKYGVDHHWKTEESQSARKAAWVEKYGVEYPAQSPVVKDKMKSTNISTYGVEYYSQSETAKENSKKINTGLQAWNNGVVCIKVIPGTVLSPEFTRGFLPRKRKYEKSKSITNGVITKRIPIGQEPPEGWKFGKTRKYIL